MDPGLRVGSRCTWVGASSSFVPTPGMVGAGCVPRSAISMDRRTNLVSNFRIWISHEGPLVLSQQDLMRFVDHIRFSIQSMRTNPSCVQFPENTSLLFATVLEENPPIEVGIATLAACCDRFVPSGRLSLRTCGFSIAIFS